MSVSTNVSRERERKRVHVCTCVCVCMCVWNTDGRQSVGRLDWKLYEWEGGTEDGDGGGDPNRGRNRGSLFGSEPVKALRQSFRFVFIRGQGQQNSSLPRTTPPTDLRGVRLDSSHNFCLQTKREYRSSLVNRTQSRRTRPIYTLILRPGSVSV